MKAARLPCDWDDLAPPSGSTILFVDLYLRRQDVIDEIDARVRPRINGAAGRRDLTKRDLAKLYVHLADDPIHQDWNDIMDGRQKGDVLRLLADELGFFASADQDAVVKEQAIQILLFLIAGEIAPRMPSLPSSSQVDDDLETYRRQEREQAQTTPTLAAQ